MNCKFIIDKPDGRRIQFDAVNNVTIEKSIDKIDSLAKIRIPTSARLISSDNSELAQTAKTFGRGDKITVYLGYDADLRKEFEGFIYKINLTTPLEIECEGYEFLLRGNVPTKTFASTNLKSLLRYIVGDELLNSKQIVIDERVPDVNMVNYVVPANLTRKDALQQIKERYGLTIFFNDNILYTGLDFVRYEGNAIYSLGVNTPKADELRYQYAEDVKVKVKAVQVNKDNTKLEAEIGDKDGAVRTLFFYTAKNIEDLKKLAETEIKKYKYTGYAGKITTFLQPFALPGMVAEIRDIKYAERQGKYEIRSTQVSFGTGGGRRVVEIGKTVSDGSANRTNN